MTLDKWHKTGKQRYRTNIFGKVILQIEETGCFMQIHGGLPDYPPYNSFRWRDAKIEDIT